MKIVKLYSDGSSLGNPGAGGWCAILRCCNKEKCYTGGAFNTTNNIMELAGVIEGLKQLTEPCKVIIYSDSNYVVQGISEWLPKWIKNKWKTSSNKPVKNKELWQMYVSVSHTHEIETVWIKGHSGHELNERCDKLAVETAYTFKNNISIIDTNELYERN